MSRKKTITQLAIIIPVFNGYSYLEKCLKAIPKASEKTAYKIYAVDNGSEEFDRRNFWKEFGNLVDKFYVSDRPLGFPGACNLGATLAKNEKYLLFLNSDCIMSPGSIDIMVNRMKSDQTIGALGPKLVFPSDGNMGKGGTVQHAGLDFDVHGRPTHTFIGWSVDNPKVNVSGEVDALTGASLLIRKNLFEKVKGFDVAYGLGCLHGESLIYTDLGIKRIQTLMGSEIDSKIAIKISSREGIYKANLAHNNGYYKTLEMKTKNSFSIRATPNHKFIIMGTDGVPKWEEMQNIQPDDYVAIKVGANLWGTNTIDRDSGYLVGLYLAEGSVDTYGGFSRVCITNADKKIQEFLVGFGFKSHDNLHYRSGKKHINNILTGAGLDLNRNALTKELSDFILSMDKNSIISVLQGMFDGDGCAIKDGRVTYSSSSFALIKQLQLVLLNMGMVTSISKRISTGKEKSPNYILDFGSDSKLFYETVGFRLQRKQEKKALVRDSLGRLIPYQSVWVRDLYRLEDYKKREQHKYFSVNSLKSKGKRDKTITKLLSNRKRFSNSKEYKHLDSLVKENIFWAKVLFVGNEESCDTFDLHVPEVNNYQANGFISHNTYEDCDICLNIKEQGFIIYYEPEAVGEHYVGASAKENNIAYPLNNNYYLFASRWGSKIKSKPWTLWRRL